MAAPDGIVWGAIKGSYGRIGIHTDVTYPEDNTAKVTIQIWFWSKYSVSDKNNRYFFNNNASSATTEVDTDITINHSVNSGSGWSTSNQTRIAKHEYVYTRTSSAKKINCAAKFSGIDIVSNGASMVASTSYTIKALPTYTISYNANGGTGAPSSQSKLHGTAITLSSMKPTRSGYTFLGWNTSSTATTASYAAGANFTANMTVTLYAIWRSNSFTVTYNANGGTGAPSSQIKTYGVTLTLSSTVPTRTDYKFLGWGVSASSTTATYSAGGSYTANASITLYAVWAIDYTKPRITDVSLYRSNSSGSATEEGTYFTISFSWATDKTVSSVTVQWKVTTASSWTTATLTASGTSGTISNRVLGSNAISTESSYDVKITVTDTSGSSVVNKLLSSQVYSIDVKSGGKGVSIGKPASTDNLFDVNFPSKFRSTVSVDGTASFGTLSATTATITTLKDASGTKLTNGLAIYESGGSTDPDTTLDHLILTTTNTPVSGAFFYIKTEFYSTKSTTTARMQTAFPYSLALPPYYRYYYNGAWSAWTSIATTAMSDAISLYLQSNEIFATTANTHVKVPFTQYRAPASTTKLQFSSANNGVVVGKGVSYVSVSGWVDARGGAAGGAYEVQPRCNNSSMGSTYHYKNNTNYHSMIFGEILYPVSQGDVITLYFKSPFTSSTDAQKAGLARLTVKVAG